MKTILFILAVMLAAVVPASANWTSFGGASQADERPAACRTNDAPAGSSVYSQPEVWTLTITATPGYADYSQTPEVVTVNPTITVATRFLCHDWHSQKVYRNVSDLHGPPFDSLDKLGAILREMHVIPDLLANP